MILESIVTTVSPEGEVNIAPMGPIVQEDTVQKETVQDETTESNTRDCCLSFLLRPYQGSRTCRNLLATGRAVIHVTDDALLLARAAIGRVDPEGLVCPVDELSAEYVRLIDCHRWFAVKVIKKGGDPPRHELTAISVADGIVRPFFGFNRAKHAVIEAAIIATRIGMIDEATIRDDMKRLRVPVEKTAGPDERSAFEMVDAFIEQRLSGSPESEG
ncbi:DUF447 domain-containing protein [Rhodopirellula sallentina]|uniref:Protein containing DUF447 n=1 Tax=Rhodopirellula sallentina SM41 TaxID=1263870 RepID=M5U8Z2_9BACT|nr:DUF447 domain-containing protein [Rhodopirellula sallentina]EMI52443.1 protein containing DUF447 [Rhodopirellula sallentina SM41]